MDDLNPKKEEGGQALSPCENHQDASEIKWH
jgi:hypothetical protein